LFAATPIRAATDYISAYFNNNQKVTVNGTEKQIQFLNASDTNYGKLRDIVNALGGETVYNNATQTIEITTSSGVATPQAIPVLTPSPSLSTSANTNNMESDKNMSTTTAYKIFVNQKEFLPFASPVYLNDEIYCPPASVRDIVNGNAKWNEQSQEFTLTKGNNSITFKDEIIIISNTHYIPLKKAVEFFGGTYIISGENIIITIN
jgi:hypothetical protein